MSGKKSIVNYTRDLNLTVQKNGICSTKNLLVRKKSEMSEIIIRMAIYMIDVPADHSENQ